MSLLSLLVRIGGDASGFLIAAKQTEGAVNKLSGTINGRLKGQIAGAFGIGALIAYEKHVIEFASHINDLSDRVDASTDALQEWSYAAKQNGADIDDVVGFFEKLGQARQKALGNNQESIASFKKLGVTLDDLKKKRLEDVAMGISKSVMKGDPQALGASLRDVGGRSSPRLIATFKSDVEALAKAAHDAGAIIKKETIQQLDDLGDAADNLAKVLMTSAAEGLVKFMDGLSMLLTGVKAIAAYAGNLSVNWKTSLHDFMQSFYTADQIKQGKGLPPGMVPGGEQPITGDTPWDAFQKTIKKDADAMVARQEERKNKKASIIGEATDSGAAKAVDKMSVTAREQIGAYIGGANPLLQVAQRSERHLWEIRQALILMNQKQVLGGFSDSSGDKYA